MRFDEKTHSYFEGKKRVISVTQLLKKHNLSPYFGNVPEETLLKAREKGVLIHEEIENFIKNGDIGFSDELVFFMDNMPQGKLSAEVMLNYGTEYAGTADLISENEDGTIFMYDHKTGTFHKDSVKWQLSLYAFAYKQMTGKQVDKLFCYAYQKKQVVQISFIPEEKILKLLEAERKGEIFEDEDLTELAINKATENSLIELGKVQNFLMQMKEYEAKEKELKSRLLDYMKSKDIKSFESDTIKLTVKDASVRKSFDEKTFRSEHPEFDGQYIKETKVKESLVCTIRI